MKEFSNLLWRIANELPEVQFSTIPCKPRHKYLFMVPDASKIVEHDIKGKNACYYKIQGVFLKGHTTKGLVILHLPKSGFEIALRSCTERNVSSLEKPFVIEFSRKSKKVMVIHSIRSATRGEING